MTRVAVLGAGGRMGAEVCRAVDAAADLELVAAVDPAAAGVALAERTGVHASEIEIAAGLEAVAEASAEVAIDFTVAGAARANLAWCVARGIHVVCGTTGLDTEAIDDLRAHLGHPPRANVVLAPNFAVSAVLLLRLAELAAPHFDGVEIVELHHEHKLDAPSGTAIETASRIARARSDAGAGPFVADPTEVERVEGARGALGPGGIRIHALRLPGLVAHEEVVFGALGQTLTLRQDSTDRRSFMPGVLLAARRVASTPGLTIGLDRLLGLGA